VLSLAISVQTEPPSFVGAEACAQVEPKSFEKYIPIPSEDDERYCPELSDEIPYHAAIGAEVNVHVDPKSLDTHIFPLPN
jgi:hypothetical protein